MFLLQLVVFQLYELIFTLRTSGDAKSSGVENSVLKNIGFLKKFLGFKNYCRDC